MAGVMNLALNQPEEFEMKIADATEEMMLGRWVRSPSKYDNWEAYMDWFGMSAQEIRDETVEPQIHVIKAFSKESITILHILPERDGLQVEYTVPIDGKQYQIPPIMVKNARSSWKGNQTWAHEWTERGLRTLQVQGWVVLGVGSSRISDRCSTSPRANSISGTGATSSMKMKSR